MKIMYVYIVRCADGSYYTGVTNNLGQRIMQHNESDIRSSYTYSRKPVELVFSESFAEPMHAIHCEKQLKRWSRAKKEALIKGDWDVLKKFAECKNDTTHKNFHEESKHL